VVSRGPGGWKLLPLLDDSAWIERVNKYSETDADPIGDLAFGEVRDVHNKDRILKIGGDEDAVYLTSGPAIYSTETIRVEPGDIEESCHATVATNAPYADGEANFELRASIDIGEKTYVVLPPSAGMDADVYTLRPLIDANEAGAVEGDPFANRRVLLDGKVYSVGGAAETIFVRDGGNK